jgi:hypothetical protein
MKRVGLIGCGAIGRPVARALLAGKAGSHSLAAVLARAPRDLDGFPVTDTADRFLAGGHDLIIEAGGPAAFRALVPAALERCEVWAVSPVPLADPVLEREIRGISASTELPRKLLPTRAKETCLPAEVLAKDNVGAAEKPASLLARRPLGFQLALSRIVDGLTEQPCHLLRGMEAR